MAAELGKRDVAAPTKDWLSKSEVCELLGGFSESTLDREIDRGRFPRGVKYPGGGLKWRWVDVAWFLLGREIADRLAPPDESEEPDVNEPQPPSRGRTRPHTAPTDSK